MRMLQQAALHTFCACSSAIYLWVRVVFEELEMESAGDNALELCDMRRLTAGDQKAPGVSSRACRPEVEGRGR
jgi:hypothetical protein